MSAFKGTPGPWRIHRGDLTGANGNRVLLANSSMAFASAFENPEAVANTRLCHAAPELLEALVAMLDAQDVWLGDGRPDPAAATASARAAIAKATGGSA